MTWIKSRLVLPDGSPVRGEQVTATVMTAPNWVHDDGRAVGGASTHTDRDGMWYLNLMPYTQVEPPVDAHMYYQVNEGGQLWNVRVPPPPEPPPADWPPDEPWQPIWLRELIFDEPPPPQQQLWQLGGLADVAGEVTNAPDGTALVKRGGMWRVLPYQLAALADVDPATAANPVLGAPLVWLGAERGWGQVEATPPTPPTPSGMWRIYDPGPEVDPGGYTVRLELVHADPERGVVVDWGDGTTGTELPPGQTTTDHTYEEAGGYPITATYFDGESLEPETGTDDWCDIPYPRGGTHP